MTHLTDTGIPVPQPLQVERDGHQAPPGCFLPPAPLPLQDGRGLVIGAVYAIVPGYRPLVLDVWLPAPHTVPGGGAPRLVLWIHGGSWLAGDRREMPDTLRPHELFDAFTAAGLAVATIDYRHSGEASFPAQLHDAKAAVRYLREMAPVLGVDASHLGVVGESAGGHLAALVALTGDDPALEGTVGVTGPSSSVDRAAVWYGVSGLDFDNGVELPTPHRAGPPAEIDGRVPDALLENPVDLLLRHSDDAAVAASVPLHHVRSDAPPFLQLHGTADALVPFRHAEELHAALAAAGASSTLVPVEGADHCFVGHPDVPGLIARTVAHFL